MRSRLQAAVGNPDLISILSAPNKAKPAIDVIEYGTILTIAEGPRAVHETRTLYPGKTAPADVRIAEAGSLTSRHCFEAGATWASCVSDAPLATIGQVVKVAAEFGGEVQVGLDESYGTERTRAWRKLGVRHVIVKRLRDRETVGGLNWGPDDLARILELAGLGFTMTITGGIKTAKLGTFTGAPVRVVTAGRNIIGTRDPPAAAQELQEVIGGTRP